MLKSKSKAASLCEELPYWDFVGGSRPHMVLHDGSLSAGVKVKLVDIEALDDSEVNQFTGGLRSALNSLSEGTVVQFHLSVGSDFSATIRAHEKAESVTAHPLIRKIADYRKKKLREAQEGAELFKPELTVYVRVPMIGAKKASAFKKKEEFSKNAHDAYGETLDSLMQNLDTMASAFGSYGLETRILSREEMIEAVYRFFNPKRSRTEPVPKIRDYSDKDMESEILEDAEWLANGSPREQLVFGDLILGFDQFTLDSTYHRVISLKTLPEATVAGQLSSFLRMPFHYDLLLSLEVPSQADEMAKLQQKRKMAHSMAVTHGGRASDLESETKLSSTEELIRELLSTGQRIYSAQLVLLLKAPATESGNKRLNRQVRDVLSRFRALQGAEGLEETVGAWKIVKYTLPGAPMLLERARKIKTNNLADFLPVYGPREGDRDPVVILRNRLNGLVSFNAFDVGLSNYSSLVTGSSGAGKSFMNNCLLVQELARSQRVFIIDIGGSYKKLTEALGGKYLEVNLSDDYKLNPFDIPDPGIPPTNEKLKSVVSIIEQMIAENEKSKIAKIDRVLLEKAITELYEEKRKEKVIPILSDLKTKLEESPEASMKTIAKLLFSWTGSRPYGKLLDAQGSLKTDAPICTFDLKGLSQNPDLQSVMILILTEFILREVERDRVTRNRIILDEAWQLLKSEAAANFMEYCVRTLRKTGGGSGITFITQGVDEIVASPIGSAILNNTAAKFVLMQRGDSKVLASALKLNRQQLALVASLEQKKGQYSEAFMIEGDRRQVVRIYPSPFEYWLSTSDAADNQHLAKLMEGGLNLVTAIEKAAEEYPNGVSQGRAEITKEAA
ncbi:MAG: ATP-binding protein [Bdellovibrionales bacterium]|nr:ATP-binding protein [Bdellovibrionales bacterium]